MPKVWIVSTKLESDPVTLSKASCFAGKRRPLQAVVKLEIVVVVIVKLWDENKLERKTEGKGGVRISFRLVSSIL